MTSYLIKRPRRNRKSATIRSLTQENNLTAKDFIAPFFIVEGEEVKNPILSMPGHYQFSLDQAIHEIEEHLQLGIQAFIFFPVVPTQYKDPFASFALVEDSFYCKLASHLKQLYPEITLIADIALDPFTTHGQDGLVNDKGYVLNDETLEVLSKMALLYAKSGFDVVAPSDMMDGRVAALRKSLDAHGFKDVSILSYTAKYASSFYSPFREALKSTPSSGDKKSYQMNPANSREALLEAALDEQEGADILMVKPASLYLDIIHQIKERHLLPLAAYHVSGEYAMLKAASEKGWLDFLPCLYETLLSIKRAGADIIISYGAKEMAQYLKTSTELPHRVPIDRHS